MGTVCGVVLLVSVGVWLIRDDTPIPQPLSAARSDSTPLPQNIREGEQVAIVATDTAVLTNTPASTNTVVPSNTPLPTNTVEPTEVDMLSEVRSAMDAIPLMEVLDVVVNDIAKIVQVVWRTPSNDSLDVMKVQMQDIVCAYLGTGYTGYRLRMGGKNAANVTLITAAIEADVLAQIDCEAGAIRWENATSEWSVASGVQ